MEYSKIIAEEAGSRFSNSHPQNFPLPWDMMKYIQKEWSPEVYQKLTRTCKYFYASKPWVIIDFSEFSEDYYDFCQTANKAMEKNLKIWITGEPTGDNEYWDLSDLTSEAKFPQLLRSIKFYGIKDLSIRDCKLSYSDYITVTEFKPIKFLSLLHTDVTAENDPNKICFIDDLLKPLKSFKKFKFYAEKDIDFYLESAKRLADLEVSETLQELGLIWIPEYISFKYFHQFLQKNASVTSLQLCFLTLDDNNTFINDVQSYYSEPLTYKETTDFIMHNISSKIYFHVPIGNLKIEASFDKICRNCNLRLANRFLDKWVCPSNGIHWICKNCSDAFQFGGPCPFCPV